MFWVKIICLISILFAIKTYDKWSYKAFEKRIKINSMHPDWKPYCGRNFIKEDPQWFIKHGYGKYVEDKLS